MVNEIFFVSSDKVKNLHRSSDLSWEFWNFTAKDKIILYLDRTLADLF